MWRPIAFLALTSLGLAWYVRRQHQHYLQAVKQQTGAVGQAAIGGPFRLLNAKTQRPFLSIVDARDKLLVLYFGFTHCPDICPEELDKLSKALRLLSATERSLLTPVFVTVDPERDGPAELAAYMRGIMHLTFSDARTRL
jgi:protein SCO1/2